MPARAMPLLATLVSPDVSETARRVGARAKRNGRAFEHEIEEANAFYERRGLAAVYRQHPPVEGWGATLRVTGKGPADFAGVMRVRDGQGVAVAFDCKVVTRHAHYAHAERDRHQLERLLRFRDAGGQAFLLLRCLEFDVVWLLADLDALSHGNAVAIRSVAGGAVTHHLPSVAPSALAHVARGIAPAWDYRRLILDAFQ